MPYSGLVTLCSLTCKRYSNLDGHTRFKISVSVSKMLIGRITVKDIVSFTSAEAEFNVKKYLAQLDG